MLSHQHEPSLFETRPGGDLTISPQESKRAATDAEFHAFWHYYPKRVGKLDARRAYVKARTLASAAEILAGVQRYVQTKPKWQAWAHPSSWLNGGRWMDETPSTSRQPWQTVYDTCPHQPRCSSTSACRTKTALEQYKAGE